MLAAVGGAILHRPLDTGYPESIHEQEKEDHKRYNYDYPAYLVTHVSWLSGKPLYHIRRGKMPLPGKEVDDGTV